MIRRHFSTIVVLAALAGAGGLNIACGQASQTPPPPPPPSPAASTTAADPDMGTFRSDLAFLMAHTEIVLLTSMDGRSQVAVAPGYQGRVMTSTADGVEGTSFGYVHRAGVSAGVRQPHMTVMGGEDRFWLGPEGGQYALYFPPG